MRGIKQTFIPKHTCVIKEHTLKMLISETEQWIVNCCFFVFVTITKYEKIQIQ